MGELTIRRNRTFSVPQYQSAGKAEKASAAGASQKAAAAKPGFTISETLRQLMSRISQGEGQLRESRRTLGTGESVLAEVQDRLARMGQLAQEAAGGSSSDRAALQAELEQLRQDVDRMISAASAGDTPLFLDEAVDAGEGAEALLAAIMGQSSAQGESLALPEWLISGLTRELPDPERLLAALGLDKTASPSDILAAVIGRSPESDPAAGYLAALYLGAVIAGGGEPDPQGTLDGLRQLLDVTAQGVPLDQAIEELTNGTFTSMDDFLAQFTDGTAPDLQAFLVDVLLAGGGEGAGGDLLAGLLGSNLLAMLAGAEGTNLDLLMGLLTVLPSSEASPDAGPAAAGNQTDTSSGPVSVLTMGDFQVLGRDLSQVSEAGGVLTVGGTADVIIQGTGQAAQEILITGSGTVTIQNTEVSLLTIDSPQASLFTVGENVAGQVRLGDGTTLTLGGTGLLRIAGLSANQSNVLRQTGGAVVIGRPGETSEAALTLPLVLDGPVSLAARAAQVTNSSGKALAPFDVIWETLLPGWSSITAMGAENTRAKMLLLNDRVPDSVRLWLSKGEQGFPVHTLFFQGRNSAGQLLTRYAYLRWSQSAGTFQEVSMYPNPFTITGGEPGQDWSYEEESHTLHILSSQVTALSGGAGTDGNQTPFSGRIALADGIGAVGLTLGGVECRVASGRAFDLGRDNDVTLILRDGTDNRFESGMGCAGITLGKGTSLRVDREAGDSAGTLTALGKDGGAGIGRDSGAGPNRNSSILIRGGVITASGSGGGAGIGAGRHAAMGPVTILGGSVTSTGGTGGGAGIGGALGAPVGDISIRGGRVTAKAIYHAAAIGAGVQGACGDILITGTARIVRALGGDPGADIGACLFGGCGEVRVSGGADIGGAMLRRQSGIPLQTGEDTVILPQFRLSSAALGLDKISLSTREQAQAAQVTLEADRQLIDQIQTAYGALHTRLDHGLQGHYRYGGTFQGPLRDVIAANSLLQDMRQSIPFQSGQALRTHSKQGTGDVGQLLR